MASFVQLLLMLVAALSAWWLIRRMLRPQTTAEPADDLADDDFAETSAPLRRNPKGRSGAIAIEEPEEDDRPDLFPARAL
jgi:hypothetical protein